MKTNWPVKKLGEVVNRSVNSPKLKKEDYKKTGGFPVIDQSQLPIAGYIDDESYLYKGELPVIIFGDHTQVFKYIDFPFVRGADGTKIINPNKDLIDPRYLFYTLSNLKLQTHGYSRHFQYLVQKDLIIPPLIIQKKIVERLDAIRKTQELCDQQIQKTGELFESLLARLFKKIKVEKKLDDICKVIGGGTPSRVNKDFYTGDIPWITVKDLTSNEIEDSSEHVTMDAIKNSATNKVPANTVLVATRVGLGKMGITKRELCFNQDIKALICFPEVIPNYLLFFLLTKAKDIERAGHGFTVKGINQEYLKRIMVPAPSIEDQQRIVEKLEAVQNYKKLLLKQKELLKELFDSVLDKSMKGEMD